jgi:hypothetical protein
MDLVSPFLSPASAWLPERMLPSAWITHAPFAFWLMDVHRPRSVVELGTHHGFSYLVFCQAVARLGLKTRCHAIDSWQGDAHSGFYGDEVLAQLRAYHDPRYGRFSELVRSSFDDARNRFADGSIDLLHIDGRHFYDDVRHDFETWRPKLSRRAVVLFHDTHVQERDFGVFQLWREVSRRRPSFAFTHGHGLGVLGAGAHLPWRLRALLLTSHVPGWADRIREAYDQRGLALAHRYEAEAAAPGERGTGQAAAREIATGTA